MAIELKSRFCTSVIAMMMVSVPLSAGVHRAQNDKEHQVQITSVTDIGGFVGQRIRLNRTYLMNFPIERYVNFITRRTHTDWDWTKAEQHGKWLESSLISGLQGHDEQLLEKSRRQLHAILASQEPEGYLGATARIYRSKTRPTRGMDAYELYFVFHALITTYKQSGDTASLSAAKRLADYYVNNFGEGKCEFWPSSLRQPDNWHKQLNGHSNFAGHGVHYSLEGTLLCDPVTRLYEVTGDRKYLDWSLWVVNSIDRWSGWNTFSRLDSVAAGELTVDKLQPYVHSHTLHMNLMGILRLYKCTGDKSLLRKVTGAWNDIERRQMYITGGVSVAEHYEHDFVKPISGNIVETCATMSWMQLTQMLLEITGNPKYADYIERIAINHVFAAQDAQTGTCRYHTAPNGSVPNGFFHGPDCCTASGHRIISLLPSFFYAQNGKDFFINQYFPATYNDDKIRFTVEGDYPYDEQFCIRFLADSPKDERLNLRIPGWCNGAKVQLNGKLLDTGDSGYLTIKRRFRKGDVITLYFPMKVEWLQRENHSEYVLWYLPDGEHMYNSKPAKSIPYALRRGPVIYALDMVWNKGVCPDNADFSKGLYVDTKSLPVRMSTDNRDKFMSPLFETKGFYEEQPVSLIFVPFASIGQWWREGEDKPQTGDRAFSYAIWLEGK